MEMMLEQLTPVMSLMTTGSKAGFHCTKQESFSIHSKKKVGDAIFIQEWTNKK